MDVRRRGTRMDVLEWMYAYTLIIRRYLQVRR